MAVEGDARDAKGAPSAQRSGPLRHLLATLIGTGSLHRYLLLWLLLPQLVLWLAAAVFAYNLAVRYADRGIDASLLQATRSLARQVKPIGDGLLIDFPRAAQDILEADPADRFLYMVSTPPGQFILGNRQLPLPPNVQSPRLREPLFYDGLLDDMNIRLAALYLPIGEPGNPQVMLVQIARSQASRNELARGILRDTVLPLSGLILLMTMIVWASIRAGLAPLARLLRLVQARAPNDVEPLTLQAAPQEVRALVNALNGLLAAVSQSVQAQRRFVGHAAHQLRTPLAGLKSQTELALAEAGDNPALRQRLHRVQDSAVRGTRLVNQLLALARAEPEAGPARPVQRVALRALVADVVADAVPNAVKAGIELGFEGAADDPDPTAPDTPLLPPVQGAEMAGALSAAPAEVTVMGTPILLGEAVMNLVDNAIRYAGRGAEIDVRVRQDGRYATVEVSDTGPGLPPDQLEAVFGRFVRATQEGSGCGLGLAIVHEIAERHGGSASLRNVQPHGLCAELRLPLAPATRTP